MDDGEGHALGVCGLGGGGLEGGEGGLADGGGAVVEGDDDGLEGAAAGAPPQHPKGVDAGAHAEPDLAAAVGEEVVCGAPQRAARAVDVDGDDSVASAVIDAVHDVIRRAAPHHQPPRTGAGVCMATMASKVSSSPKRRRAVFSQGRRRQLRTCTSPWWANANVNVGGAAASTATAPRAASAFSDDVLRC
jgi:hypothetical protein